MTSHSDDDEFSLLHQQYTSHFPPKPSPLISSSNSDSDSRNDAVSRQNPQNGVVSIQNTPKRLKTDSNEAKRVKTTQPSSEFRKDREEWSDSAILCLLNAYVDKFNELSRGNLRGRDWEEVARIVSEKCGNSRKSVEQCKNKVDNLKKRFKLERNRMSGNGGVSSWVWFKKMEEIVGSKSSAEEMEGSGCGGGDSIQVAKRHTVPVATPMAQLSSVKVKPMPNFRWKRVVLKVSGFSLAGGGPNNVDPKVMMLVAREVAVACHHGVEIAIVVGGRNFFCGNTWVSTTGSDRRSTYQIGMMASVMNAALLQSALEKNGIPSRVQTTFPMQEVTEPYNRRRAIRHLEKGRVVIFGGIGAGSGNPLYSTDVAAALQATDLHAEAVLKGTNVDGVYDCQSQDSNATFEHISFRELISRGAISMDMMALTCCEESGIPVIVFNLLAPGNISKALCGDQVGTLIDQTGRTA